jgi:hypothetical protein
MFVSFMELLLGEKAGFVDLRPGGAKDVPAPPLPAASAEEPIVSNNPAATNAT